MKKIVSLLLVLVILLSLSACGKDNNDSSSNSGGTPAPKGETLDLIPAEIPEKFVIAPPTGVWKTEVYIKKDGSFTGHYEEKVHEYSDEYGYPNGKKFVCDFTGKFTQFIKVDNHTFAMKLDNVEASLATEEYWIEDGIWYETTGPITIEYGEWFYVYYPGKPTADLEEGFTMWYTKSETLPATLDVYGLYNQAAKYGFFG